MTDRSRIRGGVSVLTYLKDTLGQRVDYVEAGIALAREELKQLMHGFPLDYAKKLELERTADLVKELKDRDLREIKESIELKLGTSDYDQRHSAHDKEIIRLSNELSNIQGRILGTGGVAVLVIIVVQVLLHVFWKR